MANASTTLPAPIEAVRRRLSRTKAVEHGDDYSFPELVWAHFLRQREVLETGNLRGEAEAEYRRRLPAFEAAEGRLVNAYWCTTEASAVALTSKRTWRGCETRFHAATDWVARDSPDIANELHICETLAVRAREVLGGAPERIALQWILSAAGHLLGFVDQGGTKSRRETTRMVNRKRRELERIEDYYYRAGEKVGRIVYFTGMVLGVLLVAALGLGALGLLWWLSPLEPGDDPSQKLAASYTLGALGAMTSVITRMGSSKEGTFNIDFEVGRATLRTLGALRPFIGGLFGLVVYFVMAGDVVQILPNQQGSFYVFAVAAFAAGFSERWANVILGRATRVLGSEKPDEESKEPKERAATA